MALVFMHCSETPLDPEDPNKSNAVTIDADISSDRILEDIFEDPTLSDYIVTTAVDISAKVTVNPGVVIEFRENTSFQVGSGGSLDATGLPDKAIQFKGKENVEGYWYGLQFESNSASNILKYVSVTNAGSKAFSGYDSPAAIALGGNGRLVLQNSTISKSGGVGILSDGPSSKLEEFSNNIITENLGAPIYVDIQHISDFDVASQFTGNSVNYIRIHEFYSSNDVEADVHFKDLGVPYQIDKSIKASAALIIDPGVELVFTQNAGITTETGGSVQAIGTPEKPIKFSGMEDIIGSWKGVWITTASSNNKFSYVTFTGGGASSFNGNSALKACLFLNSDGLVEVTYSNFDKCGGHGLRTYSSTAQIAEFSTNVFTGNEIAPVYLSTSQYAVLDTLSSYTGNGNDYIDGYSSDLENAATWHNLGVPYTLGANTDFDVMADLTLMPGVSILAREGALIDVQSDGSLKAIGNNAKPISIIGLEPNTAGYWVGIYIRSPSMNNQMDYVTISGGGNPRHGALIKPLQNILVEDGGTLTIKNSTVKNSADAGIRQENDGTVTQEAVVFENNVSDMVVEP